MCIRVDFVVFEIIICYNSCDVVFFFKQKTAYEVLRSLVGSEICIRDRREIDGTEWLYPPGAPSTGRAPKGALQR